MPDALKQAEQTASVIGFVVKAGPDAYKDEISFLVGRTATKVTSLFSVLIPARGLRLDKEEFRLINDDTVEAVVDDQGDTQEHE